MTFRNILLTILCLVLVVGIVESKVIVKDGDTLYVVQKTLVPPVIDGVIDSVWKCVDYTWQTSYTNGSTVPDDWIDLSGWSKLLYDDSMIYGLFYAQDYDMCFVADQTWNRDAVEFYLDGDNSKTGGGQVVLPDHQWVMPYANKDALQTDALGLQYYISDDTTSMNNGGQPGYIVEFKVNVDSCVLTVEDDHLIGLEWQQDDCDAEAGPRVSISKWWQQGTVDDSWQHAENWGTGILGKAADAVDFKYVINKAGTAPVVDGELDPIYTLANQVTMSSLRNGAGFPADGQDMSFRYYGLWDDSYIYGYFQVYDANVCETADQSWNRDAVEVYLDGDNSKTGGGAVVLPDHQFVVAHALKATPAAMPLGFEYALTDFESDGSFNSSGGYNVEFRVPVDSMVLTAELGQLVGFELQTDDADAEGGPRLHVTKWWEEGIGRDDSWQHAENWGTAILGSLVQVGVAEKPASVVSRFDLAQNYPNPFNPSTQISYTLKSNSVVRLSVYNLLGQEVSVLVNGNQTAGSHTVVFSGSNLPSGVYFYKLQSANEVLTKKMALLK